MWEREQKSGQQCLRQPLGPSARALAACLITAIVVLLSLPGGAAGHPLGNFSTNQLVTVQIDPDQVRLGYVLDEGEIPTYQVLRLLGVRSAAELTSAQRQRIRTAILEQVEGNLLLRADGEPVSVGAAEAVRLSFPEGDAGLDLIRVEADFKAEVPPATSEIELENRAFELKRGWNGIQALPGEGTHVRSTAPLDDPTEQLRDYPESLLDEPLDLRAASFEVSPGNGTVSGPAGPTAAGQEEGGDGLAGTLVGSQAGGLTLLLLLGAAFGWGALHALSPGHGKALVAGYLIGARGTPRHAALLGLTVTVTHTVAVFALGFVILTASQHALADDLYPWITLVSGLLVVAVGLTVMRSRYRRWRALRGLELGVEGERTPAGDRGHDHAHGPHGHHHAHLPKGPITTRSLLALGVSGGLVPCPSALVVLLAAVSQHRVGFGMLLIAVFSLGLAATMTAVGLSVIWGGRLLKRAGPERRLLGARFAGALPALSASIIIAAGLLISLRALPEVGL